MFLPTLFETVNTSQLRVRNPLLWHYDDVLSEMQDASEA
jgi:hypothetical protein